MTLSWQVENLTQADADAGLQLSTEAGWNQVARDWSYLLKAGQGFGVRAEGRLIASSLALPYPPYFGWVSMVLVTQSYRRQGLATLLLQAAVDHLLTLRLVPMLDATPEGREVYSRMGFVDVGMIDRWHGQGDGMVAGPPLVASLAQCAPLDLQAFGAARLHLLDELKRRPGSAVLASDSGYGIARRGRHSTQIGPVVAMTPTVANGLAAQLVQVTAGAIVADVPRSAENLVRWLSGRAFTVKRRFYRMALGRANGFGDGSLVHVIAGPELG